MSYQKYIVPRIRFNRYGNDQSRDWSTVRAVKFVFRFVAGSTGVSKFDDLVVRVGADGKALTGAFRSRYKFIFDDGQFTDESLPSPVSALVGLSAEALQFQIPRDTAIAMDTQVTEVWPYIWSARMGDYYRTLNPISLNRSTRTLNEWGAFQPDGIISAKDRLRILTIGRCPGRRYTPGTDPVTSVSVAGGGSVAASTSATYASVGYNSGDGYSGSGPLFYWDPVTGDEVIAFNVSSLPVTDATGISVAVSLTFTVTRSGSSSNSFLHVCRIGGVTYSQTSPSIYTSAGSYSSSYTWTTDPSTGAAWTVAGRNAAQFGVRFNTDDDVTRIDITAWSATDSYTTAGTGNTVVTRNSLTFTIQTSEAELLLRNDRLPVNRNPPPDNIVSIVGNHFTRTLCLATDGLYISDPEHPSQFPLFQFIKIGDGTNEQNLWMHKAGGAVYIGTTVDIYRLDGDLTEYPNGTLNATLRALNVGSPPVSPAFAYEGNALVYLAADGPRAMVGENSQALRGDLELLGLGHTRYGVPPFKPSEGRHRMAMSGGYLYWIIEPDDDGTARFSAGQYLAGETASPSSRRRLLTFTHKRGSATVIYRYDFVASRWDRITYDTMRPYSITRGLNGDVLVGTKAGALTRINHGTLDNSSNIPVVLLTTNQDSGNPDRKVPLNLSLRIDTGGADAAVRVFLDGEFATTLTVNTTEESVWIGSLGDLDPFRRVQLQITGSFPRFKLYEWSVAHRNLPQHMYRFDTGPIALGNDDLRWFREIRILAQAASDFVCEVYFDDELAATETLTAESGVATVYRISLPRGTKGRQPRIVLYTTASAAATDAGFEVYWIKARTMGAGTESANLVSIWRMA